MNTKKKSKVIVLLSLVLFFFACSKENDTVLNQELQAETLLTSENSTVVSITKATDVAAAFFSQLANDPFTKSNVTIASTETIKDNKRGNEPSMYVMNYSGGGFVIVGATKDYYPILAYSDSNNFVYNEEIGGLVIWMEETKEAIRQSETLDADTKAQMRNIWRVYDPHDNFISSAIKTKVPTPEEDAFNARITQLNGLMAYVGEYTLMNLEDAINYLPSGIYSDLVSHAGFCGAPLAYTIVGIKDEYINAQVGPLLNTTWNQGSPYNSLIPGTPNAGCGTISLAQIMRFHEYPTSYTWANTATTSMQTLISDIHAILGSSSTPAQAESAFQSFGYKTTRISHNSSTAINHIHQFSKPISMGGYTGYGVGLGPTGKGHRWVCDGARTISYSQRYFVEFLVWRPGKPYSSEGKPGFDFPDFCGNGSASYFFHHNWGWGGSYDNWFSITTANPGDGDNYQYYREDIYISKP